MLKNAAVYLRVSTEEQSKHWGVQAQLSSCKKYCRENKLAIAAVYTDIISGATSNRPGFQQMLIDEKQKSCSMIVVAKLDRLARDLYLQIGTIEDLRGHGSVDDTDVVDPVDQGGQLRDERIGQGIGDVRSSYRILVLDADRDDLGLALHLHGGHAGELFHRLGQPVRVVGVLQDGTAGDDLGIRDGEGTVRLDLPVVDAAGALCHVLALVDDQ